VDRELLGVDGWSSDDHWLEPFSVGIGGQFCVFFGISRWISGGG
jgi:hypothetical protein